MKLRVINNHKEILLLCPNGTILKADENVLLELLCNFKNPSHFKGKYGYWNTDNADMDSVYGENLAYVDDFYKLVILNDKLFSKLKGNKVKYISTTEYAELHGKARPTVKKLCAEGRIEGAYKASSGWMIPENALWPERKKHKSAKMT